MSIDNMKKYSPPLALAVLAMGLFMTLLDLTIVNIAIPSLVQDLKATFDQVLWVLNAYSLLYAVLLITSGRLGDIFGPRNLFAIGVVIFTVASVLSGLAHDPNQLIAARAAQGFGAAVLAPQGLPLMTSMFAPDKRAGVFAIYGVLAGLAVVAGPTLGGFIVTHFGWRWIFFVNVPVGLLTLGLALRAVPDLRPGRRHRLDLAGVGLLTLGLLGIVFGLIEGQRYDWGTVWRGITIPEIMGAGVLVLLVFLGIQWRRQSKEPLIPFAVFKDRNYTLMVLVLAAMGFAMVGVFLPLTLYFQSVLGLNAIDAGIATAAMPFAMVLISPIVAGLANKYSGKYILITGLTLFSAGVTYMALNAQVDSSRWGLLPGLIIAGFGMGCTWTPIFSLATRNLPPHLAGVASGVINTIQELGGVIALAAIGALLQSRLAVGLHDQAVRYSTQLPAQYRDSFVSGFSQAAHTGFEVGRGQTGGALQLPPGVPASVIHTLQVLAHDVFTNAFVTAMRPAMLLTAAVVLVAALGCFAVRARRPEPALVAHEQASVA